MDKLLIYDELSKFTPVQISPKFYAKNMIRGLAKKMSKKVYQRSQQVVCHVR